MRALTLLLSTLVLTVAAGCDRANSAKTLKLAHSLDPGHPVHLAMERMAEELEVRSGGAMKIAIYPSGQLGSERELIELLQVGSLAMTKVSASPLESFLPEMKIFGIPYLFKDHEHYWAVLNSEIGRNLLLAPERIRLRGLGYYDAGSRSFYSTENRIETPDDLTGMKIRVMKSQTAVETVDYLGGSATPIAWGELYTSLQQGVVDGAENNPPTFLISRHFEVARSYRFKKGSGLPVRIPVIEMVEIGAGGGSIASVDGLGRIQVGPKSAGSTPGPAAYGRVRGLRGHLLPQRSPGGRLPGVRARVGVRRG